jgi:hypothetical protein
MELYSRSNVEFFDFDITVKDGNACIWVPGQMEPIIISKDYGLLVRVSSEGPSNASIYKRNLRKA